MTSFRNGAHRLDFASLYQVGGQSEGYDLRLAFGGERRLKIRVGRKLEFRPAM